jgi:hypothetical protein
MSVLTAWSFSCQSYVRNWSLAAFCLQRLQALAEGDSFTDDVQVRGDESIPANHKAGAQPLVFTITSGERYHHHRFARQGGDLFHGLHSRLRCVRAAFGHRRIFPFVAGRGCTWPRSRTYFPGG